ncbi:hypothetical protein OF83DRAFT_1173542 [Amylostereum chailletii]|nr:hypothetical protein OF83DRAFT_1173542 [Amylostereum chailletii]
MPSLSSPVHVLGSQIAIRARFYQARAEAPKRAQVPTIIPKHESALLPRFPAVEILLGTQTPVHDCWVTVTDERGRQHRFLVSCTFHPQVAVNYAMRARFPDLPSWNGEAVVMAIGSRNRVVSLRGDAQLALADAALRMFISRVQADLVGLEGLTLPFDIPTDI